jgi:hypothetical protein
MPYLYHPREIRDPSIYQRRAIQEEMNRQSRLGMMEGHRQYAAGQEALYGFAPVAAGQVPAAVAPSGPLPLPAYGMPADSRFSEADDRHREFMYDWAEKELAHQYGILETDRAAQLDREMAEQEHGYDVDLANMDAAKQREYLQGQMDFQRLGTRGRLMESQMGLMNEFEQIQMENVQTGLDSGLLYYTPEQKKSMSQIDDAMAKLQGDPRFNDENRLKAMGMLQAKKKAILLNPMETPPDERPKSMEERLRGLIHNFDAVKDLPWMINSDGEPMLPRGYQVPEAGGMGQPSIRMQRVMAATGMAQDKVTAAQLDAREAKNTYIENRIKQKQTLRKEDGTVQTDISGAPVEEFVPREQAQREADEMWEAYERQIGIRPSEQEEARIKAAQEMLAEPRTSVFDGPTDYVSPGTAREFEERTLRGVPMPPAPEPVEGVYDIPATEAGTQGVAEGLWEMIKGNADPQFKEGFMRALTNPLGALNTLRGGSQEPGRAKVPVAELPEVRTEEELNALNLGPGDEYVWIKPDGTRVVVEIE